MGVCPNLDILSPVGAMSAWPDGAPTGLKEHWGWRVIPRLARRGLDDNTRVQNRSRQVGNELQHKRSRCGEGGGLPHLGGRANLFPAEIAERPVPRPLGGEGGLQPAFSPAWAGRVRGSKTHVPTETMPEVFVLTFAFCILLLPLSQTNTILAKTPSPPALRSPLSPKGARENKSLVWRRIRDRA